MALAATACVTARSDARIVRGGRLGLTTTIMATPDANTWTPDAILGGVPENYDAAPARLIVEPYVAYGWRRVELLLRAPSLRRASRSDYPASDGPTQLGAAVMLDLYVKLVERGPWHAGLGLETAGGAYAVATHQWARDHAISLTTRAIYTGRDGSRAMPLHNVQLQGQVAYTYDAAPWQLTGFVGVITHAGAGDGNTLHQFAALDGGQPLVTFRDALYAGVGASWR